MAESAAGSSEEHVLIEVISQGTENTLTTSQTIGGKIFDHLQMMEYYEYLKEYDERFFKGMFKRPNMLHTLDEDDAKLSVDFLNKWERKNATQNMRNWKLENNSITKLQFIAQFSEHCTPEEPTYGGGPFFTEPNTSIQDDRLEKAENEWCIRPAVAREWGPTFDRLLGLYNTQDMRRMIQTLLRSNDEMCERMKRYQ